MIVLYSKHRKRLNSKKTEEQSRISPLDVVLIELKASQPKIRENTGEDLRHLAHHISGLIRSYYSLKFTRDFDDLTSREFLRELSWHGISPEKLRLLGNLVQRLDLIRFAEESTGASDQRALSIQFEPWMESL